MKKIIQHIAPALLIGFTALAFGQAKSLSNLTPKKFSDILVKGRCITLTSDEKFSNSMSSFGITASGLCSCMQEEMAYLVSDGLAFKVMAGVAKINSKIATTEDDEKATEEWGKLLGNSFRACSSKLRRLD